MNRRTMPCGPSPRRKRSPSKAKLDLRCGIASAILVTAWPHCGSLALRARIIAAAGTSGGPAPISENHDPMRASGPERTGRYAASSPRSMIAELWVIQPTEIRSTPEAATAPTVSRLIRPEASVTARPSTMATA